MVRHQKRDDSGGSKGRVSVYSYAAKVRLVRVSGRYASVIKRRLSLSGGAGCWRTMATQELQNWGVRPEIMVIGTSLKKKYYCDVTEAVLLHTYHANLSGKRPSYLVDQIRVGMRVKARH